jgi:oligosaccharide repeat unit polymerase
MSQIVEPSEQRDRSLILPGYLFTIFAMVMVAAGVALVGPRVVFGYYADWWAAKTAGADSRWIDIGIIFMQAGVYALLASDDRRHRMRRYFAYAVGFIIIVIAIQKGARAQLIAFAIGAGWCYTQRIRRVRPSVVIACAVMALLVLPVLREWRHVRSVADSRQSSIHELATAAFIEMGGSAYTLAYTMDFLPNRGYAWGVSYRNSLIHTIPNLGLTPKRGWGESDIRDSPSRWITSVLSPIWAAQGGGYGSSMMTELYFNFGLPGIALGATLLGFVTGRIRNASRKSALWLVASALVFAGMTIHVRNVIGAPLKMMIWPVVGLAVFRFVVAPLMSKAGGRVAALVEQEPRSLPSAPDLDSTR